MRASGVAVDVVETVAWVTISDPPKRNALSGDMLRRLAGELRRLDCERDVAVIVVRGDAGNFSAGMNLSSAHQPSASAGDETMPMEAVESALADAAKPTIALIEGACIGAGLSLALWCDLRVASEGARFAVTAARIGAVYPVGSIRALVHQVGASATRRILFTADGLDCAEALRLGLVDFVCDPVNVSESVADLAGRIASGSQLSVRASKELIRQTITRPELAEDSYLKWDQESRSSGELDEGIASFREHRAPRFPWAAGRAVDPDQTGS